MGRTASTVQEWFHLNQEELIHCPYQLGNLKITKSSCRKRRLRSCEWDYETTPEDYVLFAFQRHLMVCRQCDHLESGDSDPVGMVNSARGKAESLKAQKISRAI